MQFLYFVEGSQETPEQLKYAFDRQPIKRQVLGAGPSGSPGCIMSLGEAARVGYYKDTQQWRKFPDAPIWLGWYTDEALPTPEDLARPEQLGGLLVKLGSNTEWLVPVARALTEADGDRRWVTTLPRALDLNEDGQWIYGEVVKEYARLWEIAELWWDARMSIVDDTKTAPDVQQCLYWAVEVLQANYRVSALELVVLKALLTGTHEEVLNALIDWHTIVEITERMSADETDSQKKSRGS